MKSRELKRAEGDARNEAWRALDTPTKLRIIGTRRGASKRQIARLTGAAK